MMRGVGIAALVAACALLGACVTWKSSLISHNLSGTNSGNDTSLAPSFSPDGTRILFMSSASDLVGADTNGTQDVFVHDMTSDTTALVTANSAGTDSANGRSTGPAFSPDGSKVAFTSGATDLGPTDTNGANDVYIRDLVAGTTTLVSRGTSGAGGNGASDRPVFSPDGRSLAFYSAASDLGPTDTNGAIDVYVTDLRTGAVRLVSVNLSGTDSGNGPSGGDAFFDPLVRFSPDSTKIAFSSAASNLVATDSNGKNDVFVRDLTTATTSLVSVNGVGTDSGNGYSVFPVFSPDGSKVAFTSAASDLGPANPAGSQDIYLRDLVAGTTRLVAPSAPCTGFDFGSSEYAAFSPDGSSIAFSTNSNLSPPDTNGSCDTYLHTFATGSYRLLSVNATGTDGGNNWTHLPVFSPDGSRLVMYTYANNMIGGDTNGEPDLITRELADDVTTLVSQNAAGNGTAQGASSDPHFSTDGKQIVFTSAAGDLGATDTNSNLDIYLAAASG